MIRLHETDREAFIRGAKDSEDGGEPQPQFGMLRNLVLIRYALFQQEVRRAAEALGETHPSVRRLQKLAGTTGEILADLARKEEISQIQVAEAPEGGALIHGRVVDPSGQGIPGLVVLVTDRAAKGLKAFEKAKTGAGGYFAFSLDAERVTGLAKTEMFLNVSTEQGDVLISDTTPVSVEPGSQVFKTITIDASNVSPTQDTETSFSPEAGKEGKDG